MKIKQPNCIRRLLRLVLWAVLVVPCVLFIGLVILKGFPNESKVITMGKLVCKFPPEYPIRVSEAFFSIDVLWPDLKPASVSFLSPHQISVAVINAGRVEFMRSNGEPEKLARRFNERNRSRMVGRDSAGFDVYEQVINADLGQIDRAYVKRDGEGLWIRLNENGDESNRSRAYRQINNSMELDYLMPRYLLDDFEHVDKQFRAFVAKYCTETV